MPRGGVRKGKKKTTKVGRGSFEQCVGDFCSVPRGGVKKKEERETKCTTRWCKKEKKRSETDWAVCRGLLLCATRWRKGKMEKSRCVGRVRLVPRGGVRGK